MIEKRDAVIARLFSNLHTSLALETGIKFSTILLEIGAQLLFYTWISLLLNAY